MPNSLETHEQVDAYLRRTIACANLCCERGLVLLFRQSQTLFPLARVFITFGAQISGKPYVAARL
jgi:hypothetical protein